MLSGPGSATTCAGCSRAPGLTFADYDALWRWSVTDLAGFWRSIWDYFDVVAHTPPTATLADRRMPGARWFPGATLNYAENVLRMPGLADDEPGGARATPDPGAGHA